MSKVIEVSPVGIPTAIRNEFLTVIGFSSIIVRDLSKRHTEVKLIKFIPLSYK